MHHAGADGFQLVFRTRWDLLLRSHEGLGTQGVPKTGSPVAHMWSPGQPLQTTT